jgi:Gpi18-like mannosyltransferase
MKSWIRSHWLDAALLAAGLLITIALRASLLDFKSVDFFNYTKEWHNTIKAEGFAAFGHGFSNYNLAYLYLLYCVVRLFPDVPAVVAVKIPSLIADFILAWLVFRIVGTRFKPVWVAAVAAFCLLIAPTVLLNSAFWGQADAVYASVLLGCIYCLILRRDYLAMALFGLALAFKVQSLFLLPLIGALVLRGDVRWRALLWIPVVFLALLIPAWVAGRSPVDLLLIYPSQASQYEQLTMHAPSALAWIPDTGRYFRYFNAAALVVAAAAALAFVWAASRGRDKLTSGLLLELALISVLLMPFCLPRMHERYFYMADVMSIVVPFFIPSLFFVPVIMITTSFFAYQPTLFGAEPVSMGILALGVLFLLVILIRHAGKQLLAMSKDGRPPTRAVE